MRSGGDDTTEHRKLPLFDPFVQFKQQLDSTLHAAYETMLGSPGHQSPGDNNQRNPREGELNFQYAFFSPYSPTRLRHLPQPVPNDLPEGCDASLFTFEDAFEDLLAVTNDRPLPDIRQVYEQKKLLKHMFPQGEPAWFWFRRLQASGLLAPAWQTADHQSNWDKLHEELAQKSEEFEKRRLDGELSEAPQKILKDVIDTGGKLVQQIAKEMDGVRRSWDTSQQDRQARDGPDNFDELFGSLQNWAESGKNSWDSFMKTIVESTASMEKPGHSTMSTFETNLESHTKEYVDEDGNRCFKITQTKRDREGNVVARETQTFISPPSRKSIEHRRSDEYDEDDEDDKLYREQGKRVGWFWK